MEILKVAMPIFFIGMAIIHLIIAYTKKYSLIRKMEAKRYFNGSVVEKNDPEYYKGRNYTKGLALTKDKETGKAVFRKQAKMCDTAILY